MGPPGIIHFLDLTKPIKKPLFRRTSPMTRTNRILISAAILAVDLAIFFLPLTALFLVYIVLCNPPWFREFLNGLDTRK